MTDPGKRQIDMHRTGLLLLTALTLGFLAPGAAALTLEDCRISAGPAFPSIKARCGTLERPQNPDDPGAGSIQLRVAVVPALNLNPEPDPFVPIAGGPGQGSVQFYSAYAAAFEPVRRNRDILLVDQRGTGGSARLDCPIDDELVEGQYSVELTVRYTKECLESLAHDPRFFTTSVAVQDLEAVRTALGYPSLNLYGVSYGSRVAQHFARRYPDVTRTIILDGVVPPQVPLGPEIATEAQQAVDNILARCARDTDCNERFPDLAERFESLTRDLDASPARVRLAHPVTGRYETTRFGRSELASAVRLLAYQTNSIAMLPLLIAEAADGNLQPLAAQFRMTVDNMADALALGMHNAIVCTEDVPFYDPAMIDSAALAASYIGPVQLEAFEAICSVWPAGSIDDDFTSPLSTDIPTLLLSGSADPITPPRYAQLAAVHLERAWTRTNLDQGHGQIAVGCMPRVVDKFVSSRTIVVDDGNGSGDFACLDDAFVMPFFLDFAGPLP